MKRYPILQVALDFSDLSRAIPVAKEAVLGGCDWIEAGTPLIKSEGLDAIRELRKQFPQKKIIADMKIMDTGRFEVEMAAKSGADVIVVLGVTDDSTIKEAVKACKNYDCEVMVDLMNVSDLEKRASELKELDVDYICMHVSIDQQMRGMDPLQELEKISRKVDATWAIAGGINSETAPVAIENGASIVVVGGAITKAPDAKKAAEKIKKAMLEGKPIETSSYKKFTDPRQVFEKVSVANLCDAMHRRNPLLGINRVSGDKLIGKAVTVRTLPGDWAKPVEAIEEAEEGDVLIIDAQGTGKAVWGELATVSCVQRNLAGVVINGSVRDVEDIRKLDFPVYASEVRADAGEPKGLGEINVNLDIGNHTIRPDDWIVGDSDSVTVVPKEKAIEVANRALDILEKENRLREEIGRGSTLSEVANLKKWERK